MELDIQSLFQKTDSIINQRKYWLVRTMGGDYYADFLRGDYIAIGYDGIFLNDIQYALSKYKNPNSYLQDIFKSRGIKGNSGYAVSQLLKFVDSISVGDIVVVPSTNSDRISIGVIESRAYNEANAPIGEELCSFVKRIKVKWQSETSRKSLNPRMQLLFSSRHIISGIDSYSEFVDSELHDFYQKEDRTYIILKVRSHADISASDFKGIFDIFDLLDEFSMDQKLALDSSHVQIKISVQSPGDIMLWSLVPEVIAMIGLIIVFINGGGLKIEKLGLNLHTDGLLKSLSNFLDRRRDRILAKQIGEKLSKMELHDPEDFKKMMGAIREKRDNY